MNDDVTSKTTWAQRLNFIEHLGSGTVKLFRGSRIMELEACGFKLDACRLGLDACRLELEACGL
jgi:hypothetical protein